MAQSDKRVSSAGEQIVTLFRNPVTPGCDDHHIPLNGRSGNLVSDARFQPRPDFVSEWAGQTHSYGGKKHALDISSAKSKGTNTGTREINVAKSI